MSQTQTAVQKNLEAASEVLPSYQAILVAVDSSDHANRASFDAIELAKLWQARICGTHVYAAKLHDIRFRQMEGGLPEQFRQEQELERQRDVHDDLITRGLSIITDSYLDQIERLCATENIRFVRRSLEGKNYSELTREANNGQHDLLVMGAQGLGTVEGSVLGTVCERVSRRCQIDTLIIKNPQQEMRRAPVVVAVDGSTQSYGGLLRGIALAKAWQVSLHVISAFDPYYHYVAFNRIAGVLSEEAGKVFRFQEQEQLHEEIIDSGLARIYDGHLSIAREIAAEHAIDIHTKLLDGKPWEAILKYLKQVRPGLLILGQTGIHADETLDIGGNSENLLRMADCAVLLNKYEYQPQVEQLADVTTSWTHEAEERMKNVPSFVQNMARTAILRYAQERGHTVITESIVVEATKQLMPGHAERAMEEIVEAHDAGELQRLVTDRAMIWSPGAERLLHSIRDASVRDNLAKRAEKKARNEASYSVLEAHISFFLDRPATKSVMHWETAALARLSRVPEGFMRDSAKQRIIDYARHKGVETISLEIAESGLLQSREAMQQSMHTEAPGPESSICPFARASAEKTRAENTESQVAKTHWSESAVQRLQGIPAGYCRDMTRKAAESIAAKQGKTQVDASFVQQVMDTFEQGSASAEEHMPWKQSARQRIAAAPDMVRGMLIREIETWAQGQGIGCIDDATVEAVKAQWAATGVFHIPANDPHTP